MSSSREASTDGNPSGFCYNNRGTKRPYFVVDGLDGTAEDVSSDFSCPVCMDLISEAYMTSCGHTFCRSCIEQSISVSRRCPKCSFSVHSTSEIYPNHIVNQQIIKHRVAQKLTNALSSQSFSTAIYNPKDFLSLEQSCLSISDIVRMISLLQEKKDFLQATPEKTKYFLLHAFLSAFKKYKEEQIAVVSNELKYISEDLSKTEARLQELNNGKTIEDLTSISVPLSVADLADSNLCEEGFNVPHCNSIPPDDSKMTFKVKRMMLHFDDFADCYLNTRLQSLTDIDDVSGFDKFSECVTKFANYNGMRALATIDYANDKVNSSSCIASSIEFDKDNEYFAVAGLTKRIRIFDYNSVLRDSVDIHYPCIDLQCDSKISCVSWSNYLKGNLASSDYDGTVTVWDVFSHQKLHIYREHQQRCWSIDFNKVNTKLLASGSDDTHVKLWHLDSEHSLKSIEVEANVCCVQFSPKSYYHLAFGSADHFVHYYDLRNLKEPLKVLKSHKKAVSYVKFISDKEIVSASTDSQLKVWNIDDASCVKSLQGHINEKNFVGLATDGEYIACGSENNALYVYYKWLPKKLFSYKFDQRRFFLDPEHKASESTDFVSAVCWKRDSNVVVAGNSLGMIKILEMV